MDTSENFAAEEENLERCAEYLDKALLSLGIMTSLTIGGADEKASTAKAYNCIYKLLQIHQEKIAARDASNDHRHRLQVHVRSMESQIDKLTSKLQAKDKELQTMQLKEQKAVSALKAQLEKLQQERDEFHRLATASQQVRTQQSHELKKKEKEFQRLQERLAAVIAEKREGKAKSSIDISALLSKEGRERATWDGRKSDGDLYKNLVDSFEARHQTVLSENTQLRDMLQNVQIQLQHILHLNSTVCARGEPQEEAAGNGAANVGTSEDEQDGFFRLPLDLSRADLAISIDRKLKIIEEKLQHASEVGALSQSLQAQEEGQEATYWKQKAGKAQLLCAEKDHVLQMILLKSPTPSRPEEQPSAGAEEWALLEEERKSIAAEKSALQRRAAQLDAFEVELQSGRQHPEVC